MQHLAEFTDGNVQAIIEVYEGVGGPNYPPQFVACYRLAGMVQEGCQHQKGLILELQTPAVLEDLTAAQVQGEYAKVSQLRRIRYKSGEIVCRKSSAKFRWNQVCVRV